MSELTVKLGEVAKKHGKAMAKELIVVVAIPALKAAVEKSPTKIDDAIVLTLGPTLESELLKLIEGL